MTQYDCEFNNLAPKGCTQYYFGSTSQQVQTYNFDGGIHISNQDQNICVRTERGNCRQVKKCKNYRVAISFRM